MFCTNCMQEVSDPIDFEFEGIRMADVLKDVPFRVEGRSLQRLMVTVPEAYHYIFNNYHMDMGAWCDEVLAYLTDMDYEDVECPVCTEAGTLFDDEPAARQYYGDHGMKWPPRLRPDVIG